MASEKLLSTQTSILLAGALIAAGLYFGLRGREVPSPPPSASSAAATVASSAQAQAPAASSVATAPVAPAPSSAPAPDLDKVKVAALKDLERHRQAITKQCLTEVPAAQPDPPGGIKVQFNVTFDAEGRQIGRGISEDREHTRPGVGACLSRVLPALSVPPPGQTVQVFLDLSIP